MKERVGFIGAGRAGTALASSLAQAGYVLQGVSNSTWTSSQSAASYLGTTPYEDAADLVAASDIVFLAVPDRAISDVCYQLSERHAWEARHVVAHLSGADDHHRLDSARASGARTMSFHPLLAFARRERRRSFQGIYFAVEGHSDALALARDLVEALGGEVLNLPCGSKALYHMAAVIASNYLVTLAYLSCQLLVKTGIDAEHALGALLPLIQGTVDNLREVGLPEALTGPVMRGDTVTVARHLDALSALDTDKEGESVYRVLGQYTTKVAQKAGLSGETARVLRRMLAQKERECHEG